MAKENYNSRMASMANRRRENFFMQRKIDETNAKPPEKDQDPLTLWPDRQPRKKANPSQPDSPTESNSEETLRPE